MPIHELAALGAALCWAVTGTIVSGPLRLMGAQRFNRLRGWMVVAALALIVLAGGRWAGFQHAWVLALAASGIVGIMLGDTFNYAAVDRLGPRRAGAVFALNAPMAALLGWAALDETLVPQAALGIAVTVAGVAIAVLGRRPVRLHRLEQTTGALWVGVGAGLLAALGQAAGSLIARPVMAAGADPYAASLIRVAVSALALTAMMGLRSEPPVGRIPPAAWALTAATAAIGLLLGMTLLLFALQGGKVGIVSTLSATSPVLILPLLWLRTGQPPTGASWAGAAVAVAGLALIFLR
ncbi:MAG TPA: DMT family transporter [Paracoccus sp. (in: a-proteobacteria)]|nr:DMT family transporter [Paracoccus sp. (in: a-proteobacteria)]